MVFGALDFLSLKIWCFSYQWSSSKFKIGSNVAKQFHLFIINNSPKRSFTEEDKYGTLSIYLQLQVYNYSYNYNNSYSYKFKTHFLSFLLGLESAANKMNIKSILDWIELDLECHHENEGTAPPMKKLLFINAGSNLN